MRRENYGFAFIFYLKLDSVTVQQLDKSLTVLHSYKHDDKINKNKHRNSISVNKACRYNECLVCSK